MPEKKTNSKPREKKAKTLTYKGKPLVRSGNTIYYGNMTDPYVAMLQIQENKVFQDMELPEKVAVQIISTNNELRPKERIKKRTDKPSLYEAIHIASIWLDRMLEEEAAQ